jgi:hypothetical protein
MLAWLAIPNANAQQPAPFPYAAPSGAPTPNPLAMPTDYPPPPVVRFPVTSQAGDWLICVQTFKGTQSKALAEEMADYLIRDCKLAACIYDRGYKQRFEEWQRVQKIRDQHWDTIDALRKQGIEPVGTSLHFHALSFPDEFAVLVGKPNRPFKDMESARDFLVGDLRKRKVPPEMFCTRVGIAVEVEGNKTFTPQRSGYLNPYLTAMVVHNPTIALKKDTPDPEKADDFLKELNAGEKFSVLKCSKPWTLVVKVYQGQTVFEAPKSPGLLTRIGLAKKEPDVLNASGAQAHATAEFLRKMSPSFDAYVMHQRSYSLVTVGQYDSLNDPNLLANQKTLAGLQLSDKSMNRVLETLNPQPLPMKIPR